jgi:hypothetical protein
MVNNRGGADHARHINASVCSPAQRAGHLIVETVSIYEVFSTAFTATRGQQPKLPVSRSDMIA